MSQQALPNFNQLSSQNGQFSQMIPVNLNIPYQQQCEQLLTPTTPQSPFFIPPPFQPFSYSTSPNTINCSQISPIEQNFKLTKNNYNDYENCNNFCDFISVADTPDSLFDGNLDNLETNQKFSTKGDIFKFEPEDIQRLQDSCSILNLDTEYFNYDEINCQSKNQSPCSSPSIDPWMCLNLNGSESPKRNNYTDLNTLPSINTVFSQHCPLNQIDNSATENYENIYYIDQGNQSNESIENNTDSYIHSTDNYNIIIDEKPNREFKNIWDKNQIIKEEDEMIQSQNFELECRWIDCYQVFYDQKSLVSHIEKNHVELKKGEDFSCFWHGCSRRYKPFNARYKLLIHMRVHSGEKPNKCPVSLYLIFFKKKEIRKLKKQKQIQSTRMS